MLALLLTTVATTVTLVPTDDIWAYPHASDGAKDANLRVWGVDGRAVGTDASDTENYSYSLLRFDLSKIPAGTKPTWVTLKLTQVAGATYNLDVTKANPLQVRTLGGTFSEKTWTYDALSKLELGLKDEDVIGQSELKEVNADKEFAIEIDLLKKKRFEQPWTAAIKAGNTLSLLLTASVDVAQGRQSYKLFAKEAERESVRPSLTITY